MEETAAFRSEDLLGVMKRLRESSYPWTISYFDLCQELGPAIVDGFVKGRILELVSFSTMFDGRDSV